MFWQPRLNHLTAKKKRIAKKCPLQIKFSSNRSHPPHFSEKKSKLRRSPRHICHCCQYWDPCHQKVEGIFCSLPSPPKPTSLPMPHTLSLFPLSFGIPHSLVYYLFLALHHLPLWYRTLLSPATHTRTQSTRTTTPIQHKVLKKLFQTSARPKLYFSLLYNSFHLLL